MRWRRGFDAGVGGAVAARLSGLAGCDFGFWSAARPRRFRAGHAQIDRGGFEDRRIGTGAGEGDPDATGCFDDTGGATLINWARIVANSAARNAIVAGIFLD